MSEIADFINAQYDRIEKTAQAATDGPWSVGDVVSELGIADVYGPDGRVTSAYQEPCCSVEDAEHIAINDPAFVLADIESKRQLVREISTLTKFDWGEPDGSTRSDYVEAFRRVLRLLAAPFSGEPGYDAERWAV